jgi:hypothetical protein
MSEVFLIYTLSDFDGGLDEGGLTSVSLTASPDLAEVSDDDTVLDTLATADTNQVLTVDLVINGMTVGLAGQTVSIGAEISITNFSAAGFPSGTLSEILINGVAVGYSSTIELSPGDALDIGPTIPAGSQQDYEDLAACFTFGTKILSADGEVPVQDLRIGDLVATRRNGLQPIRWVCSQVTNGLGAMAPVCIKAGALGNSVDIRVSPMHRMLVSGQRAELLFGMPEMLAHAKDLRDGDLIFSEPTQQVEYFHILFDTHEIVSAHGCWSESFAPHKNAIGEFDAKTQDELLKLFPQLETNWQDALPTLLASEAALYSSK